MLSFDERSVTINVQLYLNECYLVLFNLNETKIQNEFYVLDACNDIINHHCS